MAFDIGDRVRTFFNGPGTITSPLERDEDGTAMQLVKFDNGSLQLRPISRLEPLYPEDEPKAKGKR